MCTCFNQQIKFECISNIFSYAFIQIIACHLSVKRGKWCVNEWVFHEKNIPQNFNCVPMNKANILVSYSVRHECIIWFNFVWLCFWRVYFEYRVEKKVLHLKWACCVCFPLEEQISIFITIRQQFKTNYVPWNAINTFGWLSQWWQETKDVGFITIESIVPSHRHSHGGWNAIDAERAMSDQCKATLKLHTGKMCDERNFHRLIRISYMVS